MTFAVLVGIFVTVDETIYRAGRERRSQDAFAFIASPAACLFAG